MEFSPDGEMLATGDRNGGAYVWEAETGGIVFTLGDHKEAITGLSWRADSQMLASSSEDGRVILWYAEDGFPTRTINAQAESGKPARHARQAAGRAVGAVRTQRPARHLRARQHGPNLEADGSQVARLEGFTDVPSQGRVLARRRTRLRRRLHRQGASLDAEGQATCRRTDDQPGLTVPVLILPSGAGSKRIQCRPTSPCGLPRHSERRVS